MVALNVMQGAKLLSKWNESLNTPFKFVSPKQRHLFSEENLKKIFLSTASSLVSDEKINVMLEI